ncbi:MAG: GIY-YIG nuclease family protein [archaeon]|nr:GIY-YIG nuclease family protein [archaeon]
MEEKLLQKLEETCGASCVHDPDSCKCFGVLSKEDAEDLGIDEEDNLAEDAFYKIEDCAHYQKEYHLNPSHTKFIDEYVESALEDKFTTEEKIVIKKKALDIYNSDEDDVDIKLVSYMSMLRLTKYIKVQAKIKRKQYVYLLHSKNCVKIGRSYNPKKRAHQIGVKMPFKISKVEYFNVKNMSKTESILHKEYSEFRLEGEWFDLSRKQIDSIKIYLKELE